MNLHELNPRHWAEHLIHPTAVDPTEAAIVDAEAALTLPHGFLGAAVPNTLAAMPVDQALAHLQEAPMSSPIITPAPSSFEHKLEEVGTSLKSLAAEVSAKWQKVKQAWVMISSPQTRAFLIKVGADGLQAIKDSDAAAEAKGLNLQLDEQVVADGKQLIADAKAGEGVIVNDLKILGITL